MIVKPFYAVLTIWLSLVGMHVSEADDSPDSESQQELELLQRRFLANLGMQRMPDMSQVNTTDEEMQRMTKKYLKAVRQSLQETLTFHQRACDEESYVQFHPEIDEDSEIRWAKLRLRNFSISDVTESLKRWREMGDKLLINLPCHMCCGAKLKILVRESLDRTKSKRDACAKGECCRRPLKINFKDVGWDWIVQPDEFEAFKCKGRCFKSSNNFANTHAIMQSVLHYKNFTVNRPCCAPSKVRPFNMMHYDDSNELVVTRQKGMIVKECACS